MTIPLGTTVHRPAFYGTPPNSASVRVARRLAVAGVLGGLLATAVWRANPDLDVTVARLFYDAPGHFWGQGNLAVTLVRNALVGIFFGTASLAVVMSWRLHRRGGTWLGLDKVRWLFVAICLGLGPGVVTNLIVKDQFGRARPKSVQMFGGDRQFTQPLVAAHECRRSCSFVSGEASSSFVIVFAAAVAAPAMATPILALGVVAGLATGLIRMVQGQHFLSDVVFAGIFMALTVSFAYFALARLDAALRRRWPNLLANWQ
jgi:lipid A 4'-phosphatase